MKKILIIASILYLILPLVFAAVESVNTSSEKYCLTWGSNTDCTNVTDGDISTSLLFGNALLDYIYANYTINNATTSANLTVFFYPTEWVGMNISCYNNSEWLNLMGWFMEYIPGYPLDYSQKIALPSSCLLNNKVAIKIVSNGGSDLLYYQDNNIDYFYTSCTPSCTNKDCGDDGCGGSCGSCGSGYVCRNNLCNWEAGGGGGGSGTLYTPSVTPTPILPQQQAYTGEAGTGYSFSFKQFFINIYNWFKNLFS
jgi:hypothetical protein